MGAHPYWYFVKYQPNAHQALDELRRREFEAGRYNPVTPFPNFPAGPGAPAPGARHGSIEEARKAASASGTRSILDIHAVAEEPTFFVAAPLSEDVLQSLYGTPQPSREMVERNKGFLADLERGHCVYFAVYRDGQPDELLFAGYSFD